jgi:hypothetical protein
MNFKIVSELPEHRLHIYIVEQPEENKHVEKEYFFIISHIG